MTKPVGESHCRHCFNTAKGSVAVCSAMFAQSMSMLWAAGGGDVATAVSVALDAVLDVTLAAGACQAVACG